MIGDFSLRSLGDWWKDQIVLVIILINPIGNVIESLLQYYKIISRVISGTLPLYIFCISTTPASCILCLIIIQICCHSYVKRVSRWLPIILIILSNDINLNPGPNHQNDLFNFMSWNVNSLATLPPAWRNKSMAYFVTFCFVSILFACLSAWPLAHLLAIQNLLFHLLRNKYMNFWGKWGNRTIWAFLYLK